MRGLIFLTGYKNNNMKEEATKSVYEMIRLIGDDPEREGVEETPKRVVKSWETIYGGYRQQPEDVLTARFNSENYDEMVVLKNIEFFSTCEHHMLPFFGILVIDPLILPFIINTLLSPLVILGKNF